VRNSDHLSALAAGSRLNNYCILDVLGSGGFGITYKAREDITDRIVAIKEYLPTALATRDRDGSTVRPVSESVRADYDWGLERFRQEARLLIAFKHPNIVPVLIYFEANGTGYLVMEFQDGHSLGDILSGGATLDERSVVDLIAPLLDGVEAVHRHGFLHRDIKPDNIFIRSDGSPVLLDFGAARQAVGGHSKSLTAVLTEGYAPYEQYHRDGNQGPWTDVHALGAVAFRCLLGRKPCAAPRRVDARFRQAEDPLVPDFAELRELAPTLAGPIEAALGLRETERPQSVAAFRQLLAAVAARDLARSNGEDGAATLTPDGAQARPAASVPPPPDRWARPWKTLRIVAIAALLLGGAAAGAYLGGEYARPDPAVADAEARKRAEDTARRRSIEDEASAESEARRRAEEEAEKRRAAEEEQGKADERKRRDEADAEAGREAEAARKQASEIKSIVLELRSQEAKGRPLLQDMQRLAAENAAKKREYDTIDAQLKALKPRIDRYMAELHRYEATLAEYSKRVDDYNKRCAGTLPADQYRACLEEKAELSARKIELDREKARLDAERQPLDAEIKEKRSRLETIAAAMKDNLTSWQVALEEYKAVYAHVESIRSRLAALCAASDRARNADGVRQCVRLSWQAKKRDFGALTDLPPPAR
jgi:serine/threonine protein kinase